MNARTKLNEVAIGIAVAVGAVAGLLTSSWLIFLLVSGGLIVYALQRNDIRLTANRPRRNHKRR